MKKSCSVKESKVITSKDVEGGANEDNLTEEQAYINKKLSESGIESEGLGWLEKKNIFKTINVSLNSSRSDRSQRSSPRFAKANSPKTGKWVENSFESPKTEDANKNSDNGKTPKTRSAKAESATNSPSSTKSSLLKTSETDSTETTLKTNSLQRNGEINGDSPKSSKKVYYIKIQVEEGRKEECGAASEGCSKEESPGLCSGKKRTSPPEVGDVETAKKLKMEEEEPNNGVPLKEEVPLRIEAEMERRRRGVEFKMRDIKTIVSEHESRNKKWKETFSKYKCPARWGIPIVRSCSEKWDGKRIPPKLLHRYQKYLSSNNLFHPVFLPAKPQTSAGEPNKPNSEMSSQSSIGTNSECRDESENDLKDTSEGSIAEDDTKKSVLENNLSSSSSESNGRMVLRNRSQQKPVVLEEDGYSSDDSDQWLTKQKPTKKQKVNSKCKKTANQNKQLVLKLEMCNINKKNGREDGRKNGSESFPGSPLLGNNPLNQGDGPLKLGPDPDTMVCPICSLRFKKQLIESHATECASKTYKD